MRNYRFRFVLLFFSMIVLSFPMAAQSWEFVKEKEGIKMYTRKTAGNSLKSYKGVTDINAPAEKIFAFIEDVNHTDWWDKNLSQIKVLLYEKNKRAEYYLVYDLPWPVTDRDLCVRATVVIDPVTGLSTITAVPLPWIMPENSDMIRIKVYNQTWTVKPLGKDLTQVILEGNVDPAGSIPDWLTNMLIVDSPYKVISEVKHRLGKK